MSLLRALCFTCAWSVFYTESVFAKKNESIVWLCYKSLLFRVVLTYRYMQIFQRRIPRFLRQKNVDIYNNSQVALTYRQVALKYRVSNRVILL